MTQSSFYFHIVNNKQWFRDSFIASMVSNAATALINHIYKMKLRLSLWTCDHPTLHYNNSYIYKTSINYAYFPNIRSFNLNQYILSFESSASVQLLTSFVSTTSANQMVIVCANYFYVSVLALCCQSQKFSFVVVW